VFKPLYVHTSSQVTLFRLSLADNVSCRCRTGN